MNTDTPLPIGRWEWGVVAAAAFAAFCLATANLAVPSLWHDELVHVFVAKSIAATGEPRLPSGYYYTSGTVYNYILAAFVYCFGDGERVVRTPSTLFAAVNVVLAYVALRRPAGRGVALWTAVVLALSPVSLSWAREARFYSLQQTLYLVWFALAWGAWNGGGRHGVMRWLGLLASYVAAIATAFHSVIFAGLWGGYAGWMFLVDRGQRKRWFLQGCLATGLVLATLVGYFLLLPAPERGAIFGMGDVLGGIGSDNIPQSENRIWEDPFYYFQWLGRNHSAAFLLLFLFGTAIIAAKRIFTKSPSQGELFTALAFWVPFFVLSFLIDYRRERFIFFAFPFYLAVAGIAFLWLCDQIRRSRETWWRGFVAVAIIAFMLRAGVSAVRLVGDSLEAASGAHITLARRHPLWREPCQYVKANLDGAAVLSTTYLPALYYVGQCDEMYPARYIIWEWPESPSPGLKALTELQTFVADHPRGYFLADWQRFGRWPQLREDIEWVKTHMRVVTAVSNEDITLYAWPKDE